MNYQLMIRILVFLFLITIISCKPKKQEEKSITSNNSELQKPEKTEEIKPGDEVEVAKSIKETTKVSSDTLLGRWLRPDGNYIIQINTINEDKKIEAQYFNPKPINIARAEIIPDDNLHIFIEFNDKGYEGSSYDLIYDPVNDALIGKYFQATYGQTYQIGFIRLNE